MELSPEKIGGLGIEAQLDESKFVNVNTTAGTLLKERGYLVGWVLPKQEDCLPCLLMSGIVLPEMI